MKKRLLSVFLVVCMLFTLATPAWAAETIGSGQCGDNLSWSLTSDGTLTISGTGAMTQKGWYTHTDQIKQLVISEGVTEIMTNAFSGCSNISGTLVIPESVTTIGSQAFYNCSNIFGSLVIPENVTTIGREAFYGCSGFEGSLTIGDNVKNIGDGAFGGCTGLTGNLTIGDGVESIGNRAFWGCTGLTGNLTIPNNVKIIGEHAFAQCSGFTGNLILGDNIESIGESAFSGCSGLTGSLVIPDSVRTLGNSAFWGCTGLTGNLIIGDGVESIGNSAFMNCNGLTGNLTIPNNVKTIGALAFAYCSGLTGSPIFGNNITSIGDSAFCDCSGLAGSLVLPDSVRTLGKSAFWGCTGLTGNLEIPDGVELISEMLFASCGFTSITIPKSVINVEGGSFYGCFALESLTILNENINIVSCIPNSMQTFGSCSKLKDIYFNGTKEQWTSCGGDSAVREGGISPTIHYNFAQGIKTVSGVLRSGEGWSINWSCTYYEDSDGNLSDGKLTITASGSAANEDLYIFNGDGGAFPWETEPYMGLKAAITSIDIEGTSGITLRVATNLFQNYPALKALTGSYVSGIDSNAFAGCASLQSVTVSNTDGYFSYGANTFKDCTKLSRVSFPADLQHIGAGAFQNTALGTITLGESVGEIGEGAFSGCNDLTIRCYKDSVAHQYATANGIPFELIPATDNSIVFGVDQWSFSNYGGDPYYIVNIDYKKLVNGLSNTDMEEVNSILFLEDGHTPKASTGSCYGMSATVVLAKTGRYQPSSVYTGATSLYSIPTPNDDWVESFITFYQVQYNMSAILDNFMRKSTKEQLQIIEDMASQVSSGGSPFVLCVTGENGGGHALVAYGVEYGDYSVGGSLYHSRILLYDCNYPNETTYMYYDIDTEQWQMQKYSKSKYNKLQRASSNVAVLDYFTPGLAADETLYPTAHLVSRNESNQYTLIYDGQAISIDGSTDDRENGFITYFDCCEETDGTAMPMTLLLPSITGNYSVVPDEETYYLLNYGDFALSTNCGDAERIDFIADGSVTLTGVEGDYSLSYVCNEEYQTVPWYKTTVSGNGAASITLKETNEGILLEGDLHDIEILATDKEGSYLLTLDTRQGSALVANATSANISDPVILLDMDENGTYETPYGAYTITFDANGGSGSAASAVTGVDGTLDSLPTASRGGYRFNGWYTTRSGGERVTTAFVFTGDTTIYAQWTYIGTDDGNSSGGSSSSSSSTLTFNTNGGTSISSIKKTNGTIIDLTDYVPAREGYTFSGWFADPELTEKITTLDMRKNTTIYAGWSIVNPFTDVTTDSWFYDAAMFVYERGLMNGIGAGLFGPDIATTRGMLVTILWRQDGAPEAVYDGELNDVPDTMYYAPAVKWAAANGIMGGYGDGQFGPDDPITREQMAAILWRYAQYKGYDVSVIEDSISDFNDVSAISDYAVPAMQWVCSEGIMSGKPGKILDPTGTAKRSEIAAMLMRFLENVK